MLFGLLHSVQKHLMQTIYSQAKKYFKKKVLRNMKYRNNKTLKEISSSFHYSIQNISLFYILIYWNHFVYKIVYDIPELKVSQKIIADFDGGIYVTSIFHCCQVQCQGSLCTHKCCYVHDWLCPRTWRQAWRKYSHGLNKRRPAACWFQLSL